MKESELKELTIGYLILREKQGVLMWLRLNAGIIPIGRRMIRLTPPGTADFLIIKQGKPIFIELKGDKGKQTEAQQDFGKLALENGAEYHVLRDFDELIQIC